MVNKKEIEKSLEYWSKHQELDKFNTNKDTIIYIGYLALTVSVIIISSEAIKIAFPNNPELLKIISAVLILGLAIAILYLSKKWRTKVKGHDEHFTAREIMIRYWYNNYFNAKTEELDDKLTKLIKLVSCYGRNIPKNLVDTIMKSKK